MKYKALFVFFFGIVLSLISIQNSFAGWPISYTPAIEGIVTDATTGQPIENVMVSCVWYKTRMSIGDTVDLAFGSKTVITKTDGKFSFPSKTGFHVLSWFNDVMLQANHPLYESKMNSFNKEDIAHLKKGETQYNSGGVRIIPAKYENGKILYETTLLGLEEKIKNAKEEYERTKDIYKTFNFGSFIGCYSGKYLKTYYNRDFIEMIMSKWKSLSDKNNGHEQNELKRIRKEIED